MICFLSSGYNYISLTGGSGRFYPGGYKFKREYVNLPPIEAKRIIDQGSGRKESKYGFVAMLGIESGSLA